MHRSTAFFLVTGLLGLAFLLPSPAFADWPDQPNVNLPVCTATRAQSTPVSVPDGAGGSIVAWQDYRSGVSTTDLYAQRISAAGAVQWTANGVALCTLLGDQGSPTLVSDGAGGAIVAWLDNRSSYNIYAQRISAAGAALWTANGVVLSTGQVGPSAAPAIVADGAGGAIVTWLDNRASGGFYAQRISAAGTLQWPDTVALCREVSAQAAPAIASDGAGGAIVAWGDARNAAGLDDIYAQWVSADGLVLWPENGVPLCTATGIQTNPVIVPSGAGGAIVAWTDGRGPSSNVYSQRISGGGYGQWTADGVALSTAPGDRGYPSIVTDGVGGAIVVWEDSRGGAGDIYVQRISAEGAVQWATEGAALCTAMGDQFLPAITSNGAGGAIFTWEDHRGADADIYAQGISAEGSVQWAVDGVPLSTVATAQRYPTIASDGAGGAIVAWQDGRNGSTDIYAQRIWANGTTPVLLSLVSADVDADFVTLTWLAGGSGSSAAAVYRSTVAGEWTRVGVVSADGTGYLRYTDPIDATATHVGYRLGIVDAGIEGFYGETWVDLLPRDAALAFALDPVRPNPVQGGTLTVRFTLPSPAPARLELVDVSGRRVVEREVGSLGEGQHALDLGAGQHLAPGLYLVRLTQGTNQRVARVAVL